jgi:uncharacterized MAPEG superfamily protein
MMTLPVWMLLGFATWTLLVLMFTVGIYRWSRILTARQGIAEFRSDRPEGAEWYQRATRAHMNCIENLPVFGAIVFGLYVSGTTGAVVDGLCVSILAARVLQSLVHIGFAQGSRVVPVRFSLYSVQLVAFLALLGMIVRTAVG